MAANPEPLPPTGRRAYDQIAPAVALAIEETVRETRHGLRNDIAALATQVVAGNLQSATEHAENKACMEELRGDIAELKELIPRVSSLESHDRSEDAVAKAITEARAANIEARAANRALVLGVAGVLIAAMAVLATVLIAVLT